MKHSSERFFSFRNKLIATSIACLLIPVFISLTVFNYVTRDTVREQASTSAEELLKLVENNVSNQLMNMSNVANFIQVDSEMNTIMKARVSGKVYEGPDAEYKEFSERKRIISKLDNIAIIGEKLFVTILLSNGEVFTTIDKHEYDPRQLIREPWFGSMQELTGFESLWIGANPTPIVSGQKSSPYQVTLARTLRFATSEIYGYVVVFLYEEQINRIFKQLASGREVMLVNKDGKIVSHENASLMGAMFTEAYEPKEGKDPGLVQIGDQEYLLSEVGLSAIPNWRLVSLTPYKEAISKINSTFNTVLLFQAAAFIVFLSILVYLLQKFTLPLMKLGRLASRVQEGNLEMRSNIRGKDEIGRLGMSFDQMLDRIVEMIKNMTVEQQRKRKAELAMLQAQINPHFLFNVLNSIRMKVLRSGDKESSDMISSLSKLMRMTIDSHKETITLHEELEIVIDFVKLMNMRQREKVLLDIRTAAEAHLVQVPRFFLQPMIENAIIHGFDQKAGLIKIDAEVGQSGLTLRLEDNGRGMEKEKLAAIREEISGASRQGPDKRTGGLSRIGIRNVVERMTMTFGEGFRMDIESEIGCGTRIEMQIPRREAGGSDV
ncbi:sensor histidine kinase [Paenibacillus tarimensis]